MPPKQARTVRETPGRVERLGFRVDEETKDLIERAAHLSGRKVSDFCVTALTETARRTIAEHETLVLSDRDRRRSSMRSSIRRNRASGSSARSPSTRAGSLPERGLSRT